MMVRFGNINDPKSVERVEPNQIGVRRIWLETTSEPVTTGIKLRLPWLVSQKQESSLDENFTSTIKPTLAQRLRHSNFRQGTDK